MQEHITTREQAADFLARLAKELWGRAAIDLNSVRQYTIDRMGVLAAIPPSDPHYAQAVRDTSQAILLHAGIAAVTTGDEVDVQRRLVFVQAVQILAAFLPTVPVPHTDP